MNLRQILSIIMKKLYIRLLVVVSVLLIVLANFVVHGYVENSAMEKQAHYMKELIFVESLLDERMAIVNKNFKLLRNFIELGIANKQRNDSFAKYFVYDEELNISLLEGYGDASGNEVLKGNIVYHGDFRDISDDEALGMSALLSAFDLQKLQFEVNDYDFWSAYYDDTYIIMYPWENVKETLGDVEVLFDGIKQSKQGLTAALSDDLIQNGWENGVFIDASERTLMVQKGLPVMKDDILVGMLSTNTELSVIDEWFADVQFPGRLVAIDDDGMLVYDSINEITKIHSYEEIFDADAVMAIEDSIENDTITKDRNSYYFTERLDEAQWTMALQIPRSYVEGERYHRILIYTVTNVFLLILLLLVFMYAGTKVNDEYEISKQKDEFVMMVSHDLKTPLASILGFNDMIRKRFNDKIVPKLLTHDQTTNKDASRINRNLDIISEEGERLSHSIRNILDLAKMNSGKLMLCMERFDVVEVLTDITRKLGPISLQKHVPLIISANSNNGTALYLYGDRYYLYQLYMNLIENALKYTDDGEVIIEVKTVDKSLAVIIQDTGIGIHEKMQKKVTKAFVRSQNASGRSGNGLGLTICERIVSEHKGTMQLESIEGVGTTVIVMLPKEATDACDCD